MNSYETNFKHQEARIRIISTVWISSVASAQERQTALDMLKLRIDITYNDTETGALSLLTSQSSVLAHEDLIGCSIKHVCGNCTLLLHYFNYFNTVAS